MSWLIGNLPDFSWVGVALPSVLPAGYQLVEERVDGKKYFSRKLGCSIIVSGEVTGGKRWLHLSVAHPDRLPRWQDLVEVKEILIGRERYAYQVIPPRSRHVNIHPFCLHLFSCLDGEPMPDFTKGSGSL